MKTLSCKKTILRTQITMPCRLGFHMRAAVCFIEFARQFRSDIHVRKGRCIGDGKNILGLLLLGAAWRSKLTIEARGEDAENAVQKIEAYFTTPEHCPDKEACWAPIHGSQSS